MSGGKVSELEALKLPSTHLPVSPPSLVDHERLQISSKILSTRQRRLVNRYHKLRSNKSMLELHRGFDTESPDHFNEEKKSGYLMRCPLVMS